MGNMVNKYYFNPYQYVQNKYNSIYEIPVLKLDKSLTTLQQFKNSILIITNISLHNKYSKKQIEKLQHLLNKLKNQIANKQVKIIAFPSYQFEKKATFAQLESLSTEIQIFAKVHINGENMSPLFKYLKRKSKLYVEQKMGSKKITEDFKKFIVCGTKIGTFLREQQGIRFARNECNE